MPLPLPAPGSAPVLRVLYSQQSSQHHRLSDSYTYNRWYKGICTGNTLHRTIVHESIGTWHHNVRWLSPVCTILQMLKMTATSLHHHAITQLCHILSKAAQTLNIIVTIKCFSLPLYAQQSSQHGRLSNSYTYSCMKRVERHIIGNTFNTLHRTIVYKSVDQQYCNVILATAWLLT